MPPAGRGRTVPQTHAHSKQGGAAPVKPPCIARLPQGTGNLRFRIATRLLRAAAMRTISTVLSDRQAALAFVSGCLAVSIGVVLHLPMFMMGRSNGFRLAGMAMDNGMLAGMALIIGGVLVAAYGLLPRDLAAQRRAAATISVTTPDDAPLQAAHWRLMVVLLVALVIDVMKPASLGFTVPDMISEYRVSRATVSLVPFFALMGTVAGSIVWGVLADLYGRKASIMLAAVMFVGTSICGAMPSLA